jgi:hypothetical protein
MAVSELTAGFLKNAIYQLAKAIDIEYANNFHSYEVENIYGMNVRTEDLAEVINHELLCMAYSSPKYFGQVDLMIKNEDSIHGNLMSEIINKCLGNSLLQLEIKLQSHQLDGCCIPDFYEYMHAKTEIRTDQRNEINSIKMQTAKNSEDAFYENNYQLTLNK